MTRKIPALAATLVTTILLGLALFSSGHPAARTAPAAATACLDAVAPAPAPARERAPEPALVESAPSCGGELVAQTEAP